LFALLKLVQKSLGALDLTSSGQQIDNLAHCLSLGAGSQVERDLLWIDEVGQGDGHQEMLDSAAVIQLIDQLWQLKTSHP
jgi:hypothetical protein